MSGINEAHVPISDDPQPPVRLALAYSPETAKKTFEAILPIPMFLFPQQGADLGERLTHIFTKLAKLIGSFGCNLRVNVEVAGRAFQPDFEPILERQIHHLVNYAQGGHAHWAAGHRLVPLRQVRGGKRLQPGSISATSCMPNTIRTSAPSSTNARSSGTGRWQICYGQRR